jgi:hypothetical protein
LDSIPIALDDWVGGAPGTLSGMTEATPAGGGRGARASMYTALSAGEAMHEMFRYSGNFQMGAYTASTGVLSFDKVATNI